MIDTENQQNFLGQISFSGPSVQDLLELAGFYKLINEKESRNHPLG